MAKNNASLMEDFNFEIDPEMLKQAQKMQQLQQAQTIPDLQAPDLSVDAADIQSMTQAPPKPNQEEMMGQIRERLMNRMSEYDPDKVAEGKATALEGAKPGTDVKIARALSEFFGGMTGKKSNIGMFRNQDKDAKAAALSPFKDQEAQQGKDEKLFQDFEAMDMKKKYQSLQEANLIANTDQKELQMKLSRSMLGNDEEMNDPSSSQSNQARMLFKEMVGKDAPEGATSLSLYPVVKDASSYYKSKAKALVDYAKEQRGVTRDIAKEDRAKSRKDLELEEKSQTPFGVARTPDDAKKIKEGAETKASFDKKLAELIALRKSKGAELFDREAVARGKQLSKELLLAYKNMAKLGVLSKSDESIINAVIPSDPLEWNPSSLVGQDPTMSQLEAFQTDVDTDFQSTLKTRLKGQAKQDPSGGNSAAEQWLKENPNHPKADAVRKKLGI